MIIKKIIFLFVLFTKLYSFEFTIASYNVENLFDLHFDGSEYKEYIPNTKHLWNEKTYTVKLNNILKVINDLNADILLLQEIESLKVLKEIQKNTSYKYLAFIKKENSSIALSALSKFPIIKYKSLKIDSSYIYRDILELDINIKGNKLKIFNNHWPSKKQKESSRIIYAFYLNKYISTLQEDLDYLLIGDFNSNYNENQTLLLNKDLNDAFNLSGINDILKSSKYKGSKKNLYNLWYELSYENRFSSTYRGKHITPDNILLPYSLFDNKNISYIDNSFKVFKKPYLFKKSHIYRWQMNYKKRIHKGKGFSDHLPIIASFKIAKYNKKKNHLKDKNQSIYSSSYLIYKHNIFKGKLKDFCVIYKNKNSYILKRKDQKAIYIYNSLIDLEISRSYDLNILEISEYFGLKEIKKFSILKKNKINLLYKDLFTDSYLLDLDNIKNQNEIIRNLKGIYNKGYLHYKKDNISKKIRLYAKNKKLLPENGQKVHIIEAHLSYFINSTQIIINKKSEYNAY